MRFQVTLNGTERNPFEQFGLTQNPIPSSGSREFDAALLHLQALGGEPIPHQEVGQAEAYIRAHLAGWSKEFVDMCVAAFQPGMIVKAWASFPDGAPHASIVQE
jgi:hypothetical protein